MLHQDVARFPYTEPSFRLVHGLPPLCASLHRLRMADGTLRLLAMRADQCNILQQQEDCECLPFSQNAD